MSVVIATCTSEIGIILADTRASEINLNDGLFNNFRDDFRKLLRVNNNIVVGCTGNVYDSIQLLNVLKLDKKDHYKLDDVSIELQAKAIEIDAKVHFIICGLTSQNKMGICACSSIDMYKLHYLVPNSSTEYAVQYALPFSDANQIKEFAERHITKHIPNCKDTTELVDRLHIIVKRVARMDNTVGKIMDVEIVSKKK